MNPEFIQNDGSYALTLEFASGIVSPSILEAINGIIKSEGARLHLTISQKLMILDLSEESALRAREILKGAGAKFKFPKEVYQPRVCVGSRYCKLGLVDTLPFGEQIYEKYSGLDIPYKIKIGVSGCRASCAHSTLADIGFIGRKSGYKIFVGGKSGSNPVIGQPFPESYDEEGALKMLGRVIALYCEHADPEKHFQRVSHVIEKLGFEKFKAMVTDNRQIFRSAMRNFSKARSVFYYWCVRELGESMTSLAKQLGLTQPAVGYAVDRGNEIVNKAKIKLSE